MNSSSDFKSYTIGFIEQIVLIALEIIEIFLNSGKLAKLLLKHKSLGLL